MKNRQTRIIIGILVGLVLFSSSIALLMYTKQSKSETLSPTQKSVEVYVASKHIKQGEMIGATNIEKAHLPSSYLPFTPLTQSEIVGRYASVDIFAKEPMRKEKLSMLKPTIPELNKRQRPVITTAKSDSNPQQDTVTFSLSMFQNIDATLKAGDYIDIVSVVAKKSKGRESSFDMKYVALHVLINSFVSNTTNMDTLTQIKEKKSVKADSVVFEMVPSDIKNFLSVYYKTQELNANRVYNTTKSSKGHLWMVKCSSKVDAKIQKAKDRLLVDHVVRYKKAKAAEKVTVSYEN